MGELDPKEPKRRQGLHPLVIVLIVAVVALPVLCAGLSIIGMTLIGTSAKSRFEDIADELESNQPPKPVPVEAPLDLLHWR